MELILKIWIFGRKQVGGNGWREDGLKETKDTQVPVQDLRFSTWELKGKNVITLGDFKGNTSLTGRQIGLCHGRNLR